MRITIELEPAAAAAVQPSPVVVRQQATEGLGATLEPEAAAVDAGAFAGVPTLEGVASLAQPRTNGQPGRPGTPPPTHGDTFGLTPDMGRRSTGGNAGGFRG
jgi:hypothetical protein